MNPDDPKLSALLREARVSPSLPPRFQDNVWRRIEDVETPRKSVSWIDAFVALILRPRYAVAAAGVLLVAGTLFGAYDGKQHVRQQEQARYVASVAPNPLH